MRINLVVAFARNRVIGRGGKLPWHLPDDLKRFKSLTLGRAVIMGRKTFESIGKALPERQNIVITADRGFAAPACYLARSLADALSLVTFRAECFVIGGARVFGEALPLAHRIHLTRIDAAIDGDVFFPEFDLRHWRETSRTPHPADARHAYPFEFVTLDRR